MVDGFVDSGGEEVSGEETSDYTFADDNSEQDYTPETSNEEQSEGNPAWQGILDQIPPEFHNLVKPTLQEWDSGVQSRFTTLQERYSPYNQFVESGISPEALMQSYQIAQAIDNDPVGFFTRYQEHLTENGLLEAQQEQQQADAIDFGQDEESSEVNELREQLQQLQQRNEQFYAMLNQSAEQRQQQEMAAQADQQLQSEIDELQQEVGELDEGTLREVGLRLLSLQQFQPLATMKDAYNSLMAYTSQTNQARTGPYAPKLMPSGGNRGLRQQAKNPADMTDSERRDAAEAFIADMMQQ